MADKVAGIKVDIKSDGAKRGLRDIESETKKSAAGMKSALSSALSEGMKGGTDAVKSMMSNIKGTIGSLGGLAGGLGVAELVKGAVEAKARWGDLRAGIERAGGTARNAELAQAQAQKSALAWAQDSMKVADAFDNIRNETGSIEFAQASIDTVAEAARGAHKPLEQMAAITGTLNEKFGIAAGDELKDTIADVVGLSEKGGIQFEDMAQKLGLIGAYAKEAGLQGRAGFGQMLGLMNIADNSTGNLKKGITAVGGILEQLGTTAGKAKIGAALGISSKNLGGDVTAQISAIMKATKGQKNQLEKIAGGETLKLLVDLGKTYAGALDETKGDVKTKTAAATAALSKAFTDASKSTVAWSDLQKEAASQMQEGPQKIAVALEKLRQAVAKPEVISAIEKMITMLPGVADFFASILGHGTGGLAALGAGAIGLKFAGGGIEAIIASAFKEGGKQAAGEIAGAMGSGGKGIAGSLAGFGPAIVIFAAAAALFYAASKYQAEQDQKKRDAEAADAQKMLKSGKGPLGGAHKTAGQLEAATGQEFDVDTAISDATAGQATSGESQRDKVMAERLEAKQKRMAAGLDIGNRLAGKHGLNLPQETPSDFSQFSTRGDGAKSSGGGGAAPSGPYLTSGPVSAGAAPDPNVLGSIIGNSVAAKELKVRVTNANDFGGNGPTALPFTVPGSKPR